MESLKNFSREKPAPFQTLLGTTHGGVQVFSSDYASLKQKQGYKYENYVNGIFTGYKYQCVELARRYLIVNYGVSFDSVGMAFQIFKLDSMILIKNSKRISLIAHKNGCSSMPSRGDLLIWGDAGQFKRTGHVAVISQVQPNYIKIVQQNVQDKIWQEDCSRKLRVRKSQRGNTIECSFGGSKILGWVSFAESYQAEFK